MRREERKKQIIFRGVLTVTAIAAAVVGALCLFVFFRYGRSEKAATAEMSAVSSSAAAESVSAPAEGAGGLSGDSAGPGPADEDGTDPAAEEAADGESTDPAAEEASDVESVSPAAEEADGQTGSVPEESLSGSTPPAEGTGSPANADLPDEYLRTLPWNLTLVNASHPMPEDYAVPELSWIDDEQAVDSRAYDDLMAMLEAAHEAGTTAFVLSSFREHEKQVELYTARVWRFMNEEGCTEEEAQKKAAEWVAIPGTSEHELGLAADIVDADYAELEDEQADTPSQQWLMEHCMEYGFILRYPEDKTGITGIGNEPWHYRYVGKEAAAEIYAHGFCLEEYISWLASGVGDD